MNDYCLDDVLSMIEVLNYNLTCFDLNLFGSLNKDSYLFLFF